MEPPNQMPVKKAPRAQRKARKALQKMALPKATPRNMEELWLTLRYRI